MMKFIVCTFALAVAVAYVSAQSNNITWGYVGNNDTRIFREIFQKSSKLLQVVTQDAFFPKNVSIFNVLINH